MKLICRGSQLYFSNVIFAYLCIIIITHLGGSSKSRLYCTVHKTTPNSSSLCPSKINPANKIKTFMIKT